MPHTYTIAFRFCTFLLTWSLLLCFLFLSCKEESAVDQQLFRHWDLASGNLASLSDTVKTFPLVLKIPVKQQQVDSLLSISNHLKSYDPEAALFYAEKAYELATLKNLDLRRGISLYYIALMKRQLQTWGGGIEDALVDAEMSRIIFERLDRQDWLVRVYDLMGIIHYRQYEPDRPLKLDTARMYFTQALSTLKKTKLEQKDSMALLAEILHDIGTTYETQDSFSNAKKYYDQSRNYYRRVNNQLGLARLRLSEGSLLLHKQPFHKIDSLYKLSQAFALKNHNRQMLASVYLKQNTLYSLWYRSTGDPKLFNKAVDVIRKRMDISKSDHYTCYEKLGFTYQYKAVVLYLNSEKLKQTKPDSATFYLDLAYTYLDSTLLFYKTAVDEASAKGVLTSMDDLTYNILYNCFDKVAEDRGNCNDIFEKDISAFIVKRYKVVADHMTVNLTQANLRIREMERLEQIRLGKRKRQTLLFLALGLLLFTTLVFLLFLQRAEKRKLQAKMEALRAQINPHFISNSLNAIDSLVNMGRNEDASKYLIYFSRLSRQILNNSRNPQTTLATEIQTLKHFLALEQLRFQDKLSYEIIVAPDLETNQIMVPAMILQPYIENAIWHGIKPKTTPGKISIQINRSKENLIFILEDDGIGREKSKALKTGKLSQQNSYGMKITEERLHASRKTKGAKIKIIDCYDKTGNATGTKIIIRIPITTT